MKPRIKPLRKTGDSTPYWVQLGGYGKRVVISSCACTVYNKSPLQLLANEIEDIKARLGAHGESLIELAG